MFSPVNFESYSNLNQDTFKGVIPENQIVLPKIINLETNKTF
jgi:hypothetical protein